MLGLIFLRLICNHELISICQLIQIITVAMVINEKIFPCLKYLESPENREILKVLNFDESLLPIWIQCNTYFVNNIHCFSVNFAQNYMQQILDFSGDFDFTGTGVVHGTFLYLNYMRCYYFNEKEDEYAYFSFGGSELFTYIVKTRGSDEIRCNQLSLDRSHIYQHCVDEFCQILATRFFIQNMDIGTKIVSAHSKSGTKKQGKTVNSSGLPVQALDERWNNNIIRDEPFAVKGHKRLQRHGKDFQEVKQIWISKFFKKGYNLSAGLTRLEQGK